MNIPPGEKLLECDALTAVRVIASLANPDDPNSPFSKCRAAAKTKMTDAGAKFGESSLVYGRLQGGGTKSSTIDAAKFLRLLKKGKLTEAQAAQCIAVKPKPLSQFLSGEEIDAISRPLPPADNPALALYTDWKPDVKIDLDEIAGAAVLAAEGANPGKRISTTAA